MFNLINLPSLRRICVYLPDIQTTRILETALIAEGLAAIGVTSLAAFERTMRRGHCTAIITISSCIDEIRDFSDLPIVDIQSLLDDGRQTGAIRRPSAFETLSFLQGTCFVGVRR